MRLGPRLGGHPRAAHGTRATAAEAIKAVGGTSCSEEGVAATQRPASVGRLRAASPVLASIAATSPLMRDAGQVDALAKTTSGPCDSA